VRVRHGTGQWVSLPWGWTSLSTPVVWAEPEGSDAALLSPAALLALVRRCRAPNDTAASADTRGSRARQLETERLEARVRPVAEEGVPRSHEK